MCAEVFVYIAPEACWKSRKHQQHKLPLLMAGGLAGYIQMWFSLQTSRNIAMFITE